ncbi:MAG: hypothetical protein KUG82_20485 [Pseudomonadales bacterium]|nr:hypothetical protein [Pseudomonadales bacterium]
MVDSAQVTTLILDTIDEYVKQLPERLVYKRSEETLLFGDAGIFDSIALVGLIVEVEQSIEETFSKSILLADDKAMSQKNSPFRSIRALSDYVFAKLDAA